MVAKMDEIYTSESIGEELFPSSGLVFFAIQEGWVSEFIPDDYKNERDLFKMRELKRMEDEHYRRLRLLGTFESIASVGGDFDLCCNSINLFTTPTEEQICFLKQVHSIAPLHVKGDLIQALGKSAVGGCVYSIMALLTLIKGNEDERKELESCTDQEVGKC